MMTLDKNNKKYKFDYLAPYFFYGTKDKKNSEFSKANFFKSSNVYEWERPLSPHLTIYKLESNAILSILHRITGFFLVVFCFVFPCLCIKFCQISINDFLFFQLVLKGINFIIYSSFFQFLIFAFIFIFCYHFIVGIRHIIWDSYHFGLSSKSSIEKSSIILIFILIIEVLSEFILKFYY